MMIKSKAAAIIARILIAFVAATLIIVGANKGGYKDVNNKASRICYECIGIG